MTEIRNLSHKSKNMNNWINNLRDKIRKKEAFIAELGKYKTVNCQNVHVTKVKEEYAPVEGLNKLKLENDSLSKLQTKAVPIDEGIKYPIHKVKNDLINEKFISTHREGEKLLLKNSTYKNILKEDETP